MNNITKEDKAKLLTQFVKRYRRKRNLLMKDKFKRIQDDLVKKQSIYEDDFFTVLKFLEREKRFKQLNRTQMYEYFDPIIYKQREDIKNENTINFL